MQFQTCSRRKRYICYTFTLIQKGIMIPKSCILLSWLLLSFGYLYSVPPGRSEMGVPHIKVFTPGEYNGHSKSTDIDQGEDGVIYIANENGVLIFDGSQWQIIELPGKLPAHCIKVRSDGRIYVGGQKEFGYLSVTPSGDYQYTSLSDSINHQKDKFRLVSAIHFRDDRVYFVTELRVLVFIHDKPGESIKADAGGFFSFETDQKIYLWQFRKGLQSYYDGRFQPLDNGDKLADYIVRGIMQFDEQRILVADLFKGLLLFDGVEVTPFTNDADTLLGKSQVYSAQKIGTDKYAIATRKNGVFVLNKKGRILNHFNTSNGLPTNETLQLFVDNQDGLWVLTMNGIARIEINSGVSFMSNDLGIDGSVQKIARYEEKLYVGTSTGLFRLEGGVHPTFRRMEEVKVGCSAMIRAGDKLLIGGPYSFYVLHHTSLKPITSAFVNIMDMVSSRFTPNLVVAGGFRGLMAMKIGDKEVKWLKVRDVEKFGEVYALAEDDSGNIWIAGAGGLFQVSGRKIHNDTLSFEGIRRLELPPGLEISRSRIYTTQTGTYVVSQGALWKCEDIMYQVEYLNNKKLDMRVAGLKEEQNGNIWIYSDNAGVFEYGVFENGDYHWQNTKLLELCKSTFNDIYSEGDIVWFGGPSGLIRYDKSIPLTQTAPEVLITQVRHKGVSNGAGSGKGEPLTFQQNSLGFNFSIPSYDYLENNEYQYRLDGFDEYWSDWTRNNSVGYNNLWEGNYTFKVKARDAYGNVTNETLYHFTVLPPWYRSWWAYSLYTCLVGFGIFLIVKWRSHQLTRDKERLERAVEDRTEEIKNQTRELSLQAKQLAIQAEKLREMDKLKSRFFANVSHEFRTPLTLILGPLERKLARDEHIDEKERQDLDLMRRNAKRLLDLINQLLDLAKLEAGKMKLKVDIGDIGHFFRRIAKSFSELAEKESIDFSFDVTEKAQVYFDEEKLEKIVYNLLSNAFKFTPKGGEVSMKAAISFASDHNTHMLKVSITDTGSGIPRQSLKKLFDRFYQVDSSTTKENEGSGIGLALTKELIDLHNGTINVESEQGRGSAFTVEIPIELLNPLSAGADTNESVSHELVRDLTGVRNENRHLILVVEDNAELRNYIRECLSDKYDILIAADGQEGEQLAFELIPDIIVTDVMMPKMDGMQFTERIKQNEQTSHIPVIMLTARADDESRMEGLNVGADEYVSKPFDMNELELRISNLIGQRVKIRSRLRKEILTEPSEAIVENREEEFLLRVSGIVEEHISDHQFNVTEFQRQMGMSRMQLHRKLKALTGQSAGEFIRAMRMKRALDIFQKADDINISEVAYQVGFTDPSYFTKCFKAYFKFTPSEVANKAVKDTDAHLS